MKKVAMMLGALTLCAAPALAGRDSIKIDVMANVLSSCEFTSSTPAYFTYSAIEGTVDQVAGEVTLKCNADTIRGDRVSVNYDKINSETIELSDGKGHILKARLATTGYLQPSEDGSDVIQYPVKASAAAGQWGAATGSYMGTATFEVTY